MKKLVLGFMVSAGFSNLAFAEREFYSNKGRNACLTHIAQDIVQNDPSLVGYKVGMVNERKSYLQTVNLFNESGHAILNFKGQSGTWLLGNSEYCYTPDPSDVAGILYQVKAVDGAKIIHTVLGTHVLGNNEEELKKIQERRFLKRSPGEY